MQISMQIQTQIQSKKQTHKQIQNHWRLAGDARGAAVTFPCKNMNADTNAKYDKFKYEWKTNTNKNMNSHTNTKSLAGDACGAGRLSLMWI